MQLFTAHLSAVWGCSLRQEVESASLWVSVWVNLVSDLDQENVMGAMGGSSNSTLLKVLQLSLSPLGQQITACKEEKTEIACLTVGVGGWVTALPTGRCGSEAIFHHFIHSASTLLQSANTPSNPLNSFLRLQSWSHSRVYQLTFGRTPFL
jgi:hypothetical protein